MSRYIDADNIEFFECRIPTICQPNKDSEAIIITKSIGIFAKKEQIDQIPSADVEPVRHGHWNIYPESKSFECSICEICNDLPTLYCSNCGAKMDEKEE